MNWRRFWPLIALGTGLFGFTFRPAKQPALYRLIIYGDTYGYLAPCGCTKPMSGGIARAATVISQLERDDSAHACFVLEGSLVSGASKQDQLKAECYAESAGDENAKALAFGKEEAALGEGLELEMSSLSNGVLLQSNIASSTPSLPQTVIRSGPFVLGALASDPVKIGRPLNVEVRSQRSAAEYLLSQCQPGDLPTLFIDGGEEQARQLAFSYPQLAMIIFRSSTDPLARPIQVGNVLLLTAGYHGKNVVEVSIKNHKEAGYSVITLGPDVADDSTVGRVYRNYLRRVGEEGLLGEQPRFPTAPYAGSRACANCHAADFRIWAASGHAHAYEDLAKRGHELDPDCVKCHVVALSSSSGFRSAGATPNLIEVGCEDCHGPAESHARQPHKFLLQKVASRACDNCHTPDNSPGFEFSVYWPRIKH